MVFSAISFEENRADPFRVALFAALLAPITLGIGGENVSANYMFVLVVLFATHGYRSEPVELAYMWFAMVSWLIGAIVFSGGEGDFLFRQGVSALLWIAAVILLFVKLRFSLAEISLATILVSVAYSLFVIWTIAQQSVPIADVYLVKAGLRDFVPDWPQRYVVVLMFGFFVAFERSRAGVMWALCAVLIAACIFLTFTRAAWLGLAIGLIGYFLATRLKAGQDRASRRHGFFTRIVAFGLVLGAVAYASTFEVVIKAFETIYDNMSLMLDILLSERGSFEAEGSEATRFEVWKGVWNVVALSPLTGTGFAGAHLLVEGTGSAHSQYFDLLLRTGIIGLAFYIFFLTKLLRFYARSYPGIFAALVATAIFGIFHETTKLSYGALLFFVLLNKAHELGRAAEPASDRAAVPG